MIPSIGKTSLLLPTTKEVWEAVTGTYSDGENASQIFRNKNPAMANQTGKREVTDYYLEMTYLRQELDLSLVEEWDCPSDSVRYKKMVENEWLFAFLAGLNCELDEGGEY